MNTLKIGDALFNVCSARLRGKLKLGQLGWSISIETSPQKVIREVWQPRAYSERLLKVDSVKADRWQDVFAEPICWEDDYEASKGTRHALLYVAEHNDIYSSCLKIAPVGNNKIVIDWEGKCDVWFDSYGSNLNMAIEAEGVFEGISVGDYNEIITEVEARDRLSMFMSPDAFQFEPPSELHADPKMCPIP